MTKRLQEILNRKPSKWGNLTVKEFEGDIKLLQERVQELEKELNGTKYRLGYKQMFAQCNRDYASINSENQSYRRILAFYGNPYKYVSGEIEKDEGKKARKILEGESQ